MGRSPEVSVSLTSLNQGGHDLDRKGPADSERHRQKVRKAIQDNLQDLVSNEAIITSDGQKTVKVPLPNLQHPHFRFDPNRGDRVGQGNGKSGVGDVVIPGSGGGRRGAAGTQPGEGMYEVDVSIDELAEVLFSEFGLPYLKQKAYTETESETVVFEDVRKKGPMSNLDKRRTVLENIRRNALAGKPKFGGIQDEDLRFKTWRPKMKRDSNAVVIAMRDISGSMGAFEQYISRTAYFWTKRFLESKYNNVQIAFVVHDTEAKEVDEKSFFHLRDGGGTRVSSAFKLALDLIGERYQPERWNIYPMQFSDGDNIGGDNERCVELGRELLSVSNMVAYGEIRQNEYSGWTTLMKAFDPLKQDPKFRAAEVRKKEDVYPALKHFFAGEGVPVEGAVSRA